MVDLSLTACLDVNEGNGSGVFKVVVLMHCSRTSPWAFPFLSQHWKDHGWGI